MTEERRAALRARAEGWTGCTWSATGIGPVKLLAADVLEVVAALERAEAERDRLAALVRALEAERREE